MRRALVLFVLVLLPFQLSAATRPSDSEIRALVDANMRATQAGDLDAILATIHPDSLSYSQISGLLEQMKAYNLTYRASKAEFVCMTGEYALIRVVQQTRRVSGRDFLDNELDGIWALKLDGSKWKYWSQMALTFKPLAPANQ